MYLELLMQKISCTNEKHSQLGLPHLCLPLSSSLYFSFYFLPDFPMFIVTDIEERVSNPIWKMVSPWIREGLEVPFYFFPFLKSVLE